MFDFQLFLVFKHCTRFDCPSLAFSYCIMKHQVKHMRVQAPTSPTPAPSLPRLPGTAWGSAWGEVVIQLVKWGGSSDIAPKGFSFLLSSALSGSPQLRALFSAELPREKRTKIPQCLAGGEANKSLVPDECHCLWSPVASNISLVNF